VAASNEKVIDLMGADNLARIVYDRMNLLVVCGHLDVNSLPENLVLENKGDPVRLFVKNEPHKRSKIVNKRWRTIASVSFVDSLIERAVYAPRNGLMIDNWGEIPPKPGMGATDEDIQQLASNLIKLLERGKLIDSDVVGWDWSRRKWMALCRVYVNALWFGFAPGSDGFKLSRNREVVSVNPVLVLSDGRMLTLTVNGIQLSGRYITSSGNSEERVFLSCLAGTHAIAMGDDCVETANQIPIKVIKERYASMGYDDNRKDIEFQVTEDVQETVFCSLRFYKQENAWVAEPVNAIRTLFRYVTKGKGKLNYGDFQQMVNEIRHMRMSPEQRTNLLRELYSYVTPPGVTQ
jgi:hypothetical protein